MRSFIDVFDRQSEVTAHAFGRVNLLGEHTDYNDGFVLPTTIPQSTGVQIARSDDKRYRFYSANLGHFVEYEDDGAAPSGFGKYVFGCIEVLKARGVTVPPLLVYVTSEVPMGSGLSSSAALEVAVLRALRELLSVTIDDVEIAQLAQRAEIEYAGVRCGIMDQMASSLGAPKQMLFLDTRTLERKLLPLPEGELIVIDSGVARTLATSGYNQRRSECERAASMLGVRALRDETTLNRIDELPEPLDRRARHIITENARVLEAANGVSVERFGELMNDSHASLRDDYEVSVPALDTLVLLLQEHPNVYGARLTGAGFGGACVALAHPGTANEVKITVLKNYAKAGYEGTALV